MATRVLPSGGRAFTVNNRIIRMTGGAWVPDFLLSWSAQRYRDEVRLMASGNHTVVRVNGCGIMPPEAFLDECDRRGLLIWQDFSRTSISSESRKDHLPSNDPLSCNAGILLSNMRDCILRMRSHPSLLLWCGCNEGTPQEDFGKVMQNAMLPTLDNTRPWLPSSSSDPSWEEQEIRTWSGGPYNLVPSPEYFRLYARGGKFSSKNEIGLASPPPINSMKKAIPAFNQPDLTNKALDQELGYHDATSKNYRTTFEFIQNNIGKAANLTEYLWMADLCSNMAYRAIFEAANKARPLNAGTHLWKVNAAWPSIMWQVFDWYLHPNGGYYAMRSACKPLHVQHSADDSTIQLVSTLSEVQHDLKVLMRLEASTGGTVMTQEWNASVPADTTVHVGKLPDLTRDGRLYILALTVYSPHGKEVDRSVTLVQKECRWQDFLLIEPTRVTLTIEGRSEHANEITYDLLVTNSSSIPAVHASVSLLDGPQGAEILPSFWSDNAFTLLPSESKSVSVTYRRRPTADKEPHINVEGWNIFPFEIAAENRTRLDLGLQIMEVEKDDAGSSTTVTFRVKQAHKSGVRISTWPLMVSLNGQRLRTVRFGIPPGQEGVGSLSVKVLTTSDRIVLEPV